MRAALRALAVLMAVLATAGWLPAARARRGAGPSLPYNPRPVLGSELAACSDTCDVLALPDPAKPDTSSTDTAKGAKLILSGVFGAMQAAGGTASKVIGGLGAGILAGLQGSPAQPEWETYKMQVYLKQSTDLLLCKMDAMVNQLNVAADQRMNDDDLEKFNAGIESIMDAFYESCGAMNCLNVTNLPPSRRNAAAGGVDCAFNVDSPGKQSCTKGGTFNPAKARTCKFNYGGQPATGLCDPTDGHCYDVYTHSMAVDTMKEVVALFASKDTVNNFNAFNSWWDTKATVALAKGALSKVLLLQQLIMLSGATGTNAQLMQFAEEMADKLEARYKITLDRERVAVVVNSVSRPNIHHDNYTPDNVVWPFQKGNRTLCMCGADSFARYYYKYFMAPSYVVTVNGKIRTSCQDEGTTFSKQCIPVIRYFTECGFYTTGIKFGTCYANHNLNQFCDGAWDRCVEVDNNRGDWSDFVGTFGDLQKGKAKLARDRCPDVVSTVDTLVQTATDKLARDLAIELEPVKEIIATLRNISSTGGMPQRFFGILRSTYPLLGGKCGSSKRNITLGAVRPPGTGTWQNRICPTNCQQCRPSWRCLKCVAGYRTRLGGLMCQKV